MGCLTALSGTFALQLQPFLGFPMNSVGRGKSAGLCVWLPGWAGAQWGVGTRDTHSLQPCSSCLLATGAVEPPEHHRCAEHFLSPKVSKQHFFHLPCSRKCLNCFCKNFPQNFRLRQMLSVGNIRVKSLVLQKDRGEG